MFSNVLLPTGGSVTRVEADRRYCAGVSGDALRFRVNGPPGSEYLYLLWTAKPDLQPADGSYASAQALVADMQRLAGTGTADWSMAKVTYDIVPAAGPAPLPPPAATGAATAPSLEAAQIGHRAKVWYWPWAPTWTS